MNPLGIDWENPLICAEKALDIRCSDLDDFYAGASDADRMNLFFVLLCSLHRCIEDNWQAEAAHLSFLIAYYLFVPLTPPASQELAAYYIRQAISINPCEEYSRWLALIDQGN